MAVTPVKLSPMMKRCINNTLLDPMALDGFLLLASGAALLVGLSKGGLPTIVMLAVPLLSMVMSPVKAATLLLPIFVASDMVSVWLYRRQFSRENLQILIPASLLGVLVGWLTASYTSDSAVTLLIGCIGIGFCLNTWLRRAEPPAQPADLKKGVFGERSRASPASSRTQAHHRFRCMCCHSVYPKPCLLGQPPCCSPSSTWPRCCPISNSTPTALKTFTKLHG